MPGSRILPLVGVYNSIFQVGKTEAQRTRTCLKSQSEEF